MAPEQTLRERWNEEWEKSANNLIQKELPFTVEMAKTGEYKIFDWFLAQFDEMLAEDIEKMKIQKIDIEKYRLDLIKFNRCNKSNSRLNIKEKRAWNDAIDKNISILEARRLSLKK